MENFGLNKYYSKKSFFKIIGGEISIYNEDRTRLLFFVKQKAFKLKEDITIFADQSMSKELLKIKARNVIDFSSAYDITDSESGETVGILKRRGMKSILKDEWIIMDASENEIGRVKEDSAFMALLRRFMTNLIPQTFNVFIGEKIAGILKQTFNPFIAQFNVDFSVDTEKKLDRRIGIAIVVLLQIIEGRQKS